MIKSAAITNMNQRVSLARPVSTFNMGWLINPSANPSAIEKTARDAVAKDSMALYDYWDVAAWNEPVDGVALLADLMATIHRYVFLSKDQAIAARLASER